MYNSLLVGLYFNALSVFNDLFPVWASVNVINLSVVPVSSVFIVTALATLAVPVKDAVMVPALKLPLASLATIFDAVFAFVASTAITALVAVS